MPVKRRRFCPFLNDFERPLIGSTLHRERLTNSSALSVLKNEV